MAGSRDLETHCSSFIKLSFRRATYYVCYYVCVCSDTPVFIVARNIQKCLTILFDFYFSSDRLIQFNWRSSQEWAGNKWVVVNTIKNIGYAAATYVELQRAVLYERNFHSDFKEVSHTVKYLKITNVTRFVIFCVIKKLFYIIETHLRSSFYFCLKFWFYITFSEL